MSEESISVSQYFECPSCTSDMIEEVITGVTMCTALSDIVMMEGGCVEVEYNQHELEGTHWDDGGVDRYQCANCGWVIKDEFGCSITDPEDLFGRLQQHKEIREKELNTP